MYIVCCEQVGWVLKVDVTFIRELDIDLGHVIEADGSFPLIPRYRRELPVEV